MQASTSHLSAQRASNARPTSVSSARRPLRCRPSRATPIAAVKEVRLPMPTGLVFTQKQEGGPVFVDEVTPGGPADRQGIQKGDVLTQCSAVVLKAGKEGAYEENGYGEVVYDNWKVVMFDCSGQPFKSVMSALKSNNPRWGFKEVTMFFDRPNAQ